MIGADAQYQGALVRPSALSKPDASEPERAAIRNTLSAMENYPPLRGAAYWASISTTRAFCSREARIRFHKT